MSLAVGAAGFLSALVTMFVNTADQVSIKWLLFVLWLFTTIVIILLKLIIDLSAEKKAAPPHEIPIRYLPEINGLLIKRNEHFSNQIVVGCYSFVDDVERLLALGEVHIFQEDFIQIKMLPSTSPEQVGVGASTDLKTIIIKPGVPFSAIQAQSMRES